MADLEEDLPPEPGTVSDHEHGIPGDPEDPADDDGDETGDTDHENYSDHDDQPDAYGGKAGLPEGFGVNDGLLDPEVDR